ncbi:MAG: peptide deformylase [Patescibacteria group bacterium]
MTNIIQKGDPVLTKTAREIKEEEFSSVFLGDLLSNMRKALRQEEDGYAIAAPQIGESLRVFLVSGMLFQNIKGEEDPHDDRVYINPVIRKSSKDTELMEEGCLSVRGWYGEVQRHKKIKIDAFTVDGKKFQEGASGILSQVFQHEIDHLNGILFIDKAVKLKELSIQEDSKK